MVTPAMRSAVGALPVFSALISVIESLCELLDERRCRGDCLFSTATGHSGCREYVNATSRHFHATFTLMQSDFHHSILTIVAVLGHHSFPFSIGNASFSVAEDVSQSRSAVVCNHHINFSCACRALGIQAGRSVR